MKIVGVVLSIGERTEGFAKHLLEKQPPIESFEELKKKYDL